MGKKAFTPKQQKFIDEYLIDLNGVQAVMRAGYTDNYNSAGVIATEYLKKPKIKAAIELAIAKRTKRTQITQDKVLREIARIAFADITDVTAWGYKKDKQGVVHTSVLLQPSDGLKKNVSAAIQEVSEGKDGLKVKMHAKVQALDKLCRHLGMYADLTDEGKGTPLPWHESTDTEDDTEDGPRNGSGEQE